uniref:Uncharacterized protein n=1 Tax=Alexandrium monilatum TaxID=311494 RepID=A0A7S4R365_9DINO
MAQAISARTMAQGFRRCGRQRARPLHVAASVSLAGALLASWPWESAENPRLREGFATVARRTALGAAAAALSSPCRAEAAEGAAASEERPASAAAAEEAIRAFQAGDFASAEKAWRSAVALQPGDAYSWASLGTCVSIRAQENIGLDEPLTPGSEARLQEALDCLDRAISLGLVRDPVVLNQRANLFTVWRRWSDAKEAYAEAVKVAPVGIASIPRENLALTLFQLGEDASAEREAAALLLKDPNFVDARALLAAVRWARGDTVAAENSWSEICEGVRPPEPTNLLGRAVRDAGLAVGISKYVPRAGGLEFCETYSTLDAVRGRWPPRAVAAYRSFLARRGGSEAPA